MYCTIWAEIYSAYGKINNSERSELGRARELDIHPAMEKRIDRVNGRIEGGMENIAS